MSDVPSDAQEKSGPAPYKRKLTEARREQNRRSQRVWRERQKQRREGELKAKTLKELDRAGTLVGDQIPVNELHQQQDLIQSGIDNQNLQDLEALDSSELTSSLNSIADGAFDAEYDFVDNTTENVTDHSGREVSPPHKRGLPLAVALYYHVPPDPGSEDMRHLWGVPQGSGRQIYVPPSSSRTVSGQFSSGITHYHRLTTSSASRSDGASPWIVGSPYYSSSGSEAGSSRHLSRAGPHLPSPYINHLQLIGESGFAASLTIATSLGITKASYVNDHPSPFTTGSSRTVHQIPVDLRPTAHQLMLPHPCYLDCIPFPHFRSMAIYLSSLDKLDHASLFLDLMHDGLVCWGRTGANANFGRSMRDGVAWSKRSWEAKKWFWKRWGWLARMREEDVADLTSLKESCSDDFDDEDGMLSGSQWWWSLQEDEPFEAEIVGQQDPTNSNQLIEESNLILQQPVVEEPGELNSRFENFNVAIRQTVEESILAHWDGTNFQYGQKW